MAAVFMIERMPPPPPRRQANTIYPTDQAPSYNQGSAAGTNHMTKLLSILCGLIFLIFACAWFVRTARPQIAEYYIERGTSEECLEELEARRSGELMKIDGELGDTLRGMITAAALPADSMITDSYLATRKYAVVCAISRKDSRKFVIVYDISDRAHIRFSRKISIDMG
jgi:hypothetical protein